MPHFVGFRRDLFLVFAVGLFAGEGVGGDVAVLEEGGGRVLFDGGGVELGVVGEVDQAGDRGFGAVVLLGIGRGLFDLALGEGVDEAGFRCVGFGGRAGK